MTPTAILIFAAGGMTVLRQIVRSNAGENTAGENALAGIGIGRTLIATGVLGTGILLLEANNPDAAAGFARVLFLTSLLINGTDVAAAVTRLAQ